MTASQQTISAGSRGRTGMIDIEAEIGVAMRSAVDELDRSAPDLAGMARYHLGWVTPDFRPVAPGAVDQGKRLRPMLALLCCQAAGGRREQAAPLAAAIELLHNFTLVHDDIQDRSPTRRHRPTVWTLWGAAQAINAGDALFAAAHLALYQLRERNVPDSLVLDLLAAFERMTLDIVSGQVLDLSFENRRDVAAETYLTMISGKTAAIVEYAAWAGALIGGASADEARRWAEFGLALGLGFQVQDDLLGVWGAASVTGKAEADDIRRKKQSLPVILLLAAVNERDRAELLELYAGDEVQPAGVRRVLQLMERYSVRSLVEERVRAYHDDALLALERACPGDQNAARAVLVSKVESLASRAF